MNSPNQIEGKNAKEIVLVFGKIILDYPNRSNPISKLPYNKRKIKEAIRIIFLITEINFQQGKDTKEYYEEVKEIMKEIYVHLATFITDWEDKLVKDVQDKIKLKKRVKDNSTEVLARLKHNEKMYELSLEIDKKIESNIQNLKNEVGDLFEKIESDVKMSLYKKAN